MSLGIPPTQQDVRMRYGQPALMPRSSLFNILSGLNPMSDPILNMSPLTSPLTVSPFSKTPTTLKRPDHLAKESLIDPWTRKGIIRYWAYVNDFTAAFRPVIGPIGVFIGQGLSYLYSIIDTYVVGKRVNEINQNQPVSKRRKHVAAHAVDAGVFQLFASVLVPFILIDGLRIKRLQIPGIREATESLLKALGQRGIKVFNQPKVQRYFPIVFSLATIPVTAPIVDKAFHWIMNNTVREWMDLPKLYHKKRAELNVREQVKDSFDAFSW